MAVGFGYKFHNLLRSRQGVQGALFLVAAEQGVEVVDLVGEAVDVLKSVFCRFAVGGCYGEGRCAEKFGDMYDTLLAGDFEAA